LAGISHIANNDVY
jgi:proline iminopeptidase